MLDMWLTVRVRGGRESARLCLDEGEIGRDANLPRAAFFRSSIQITWANERHQLTRAKCDILPVIDGQVDDGDRGGRKLGLERGQKTGLAAAGKAGGQGFEPWIVANHKHRFKRIVEPAQTRQQAPRSRHEQSFLDRGFWCLVEFVRDQRPGIARPTGAGAEHCIGDEAGLAQELTHAGRILAAAPRQRAVLVDQRGIVPARFGMTKEDDSAHLPIRPSMRANPDILPARTFFRARNLLKTIRVLQLPPPGTKARALYSDIQKHKVYVCLSQVSQWPR